MSDVALEMKDGEELFANKAILSAHSSYFKTVFYGDLEESWEEIVELKDIESLAMQQILGIIHHVDRRFDEPTPLFPVEVLACLWKIATDYDIPLIRKLCRQQIPKLPPAEALEIAVKSGFHEEKTEILKKASFEDIQNYLAKGITDVVFSPTDAMVIIEKRLEVEKTLIEEAVQAEKTKGEEALKAEQARSAQALEALKAKYRNCPRCQTAGTLPFNSGMYYCHVCDRYYTP